MAQFGTAALLLLWIGLLLASVPRAARRPASLYILLDLLPIAPAIITTYTAAIGSVAIAIWIRRWGYRK